MAEEPTVIKKKTKKAFVPGSGFTRRLDETARSISEYSFDAPEKGEAVESFNSTTVHSMNVSIAHTEDNEGNVENNFQKSDTFNQAAEAEQVASEHVEDNEKVDTQEINSEEIDNSKLAHEHPEGKEVDGCENVDGEEVEVEETTTHDQKTEDICSGEKEREPLSELLEEERLLLEKQADLQTRKRAIISSITTLLEEQSFLCEQEKFDEAEQVDSLICCKRSALFDLNKELGSMIPTELGRVRSLISETQKSLLTVLGNQIIDEKGTFEVEAETIQQSLEELRERMQMVQRVEEMFEPRQAQLEERRLVLNERKSLIEEEIDKETGTAAEEKRKAEVRYEELEVLVNELQAKLADAMAERSECAKIISASELREKTVRVQFGEAIDELEHEEEELTRECDELMEEKISAGGGKPSEIEAVIQELERTQINQNTLFDEKLVELNRDRTELQALECLYAEWERETKVSQNPVFDLRSKLVDASEYAQLIADQVPLAETELAAFKTKVQSLRERIPKLEAEKKEAIANRDFKGAKELAMELSETVSQIDSADSKLESLKNHVKTNRAELKIARELEACVEEELIDLEKNLEDRMQGLGEKYIEKIDQLVPSIKTVSVLTSLEAFRQTITVLLSK
jgi:chromosome segregation ATPase